MASRTALAECLRATRSPIGHCAIACVRATIALRYTGNEERERGKMLSNPRALELMQKAQRNPRIMKALEDVQKNGPGALAKYANTPEIMDVVNELRSIRQA